MQSIKLFFALGCTLFATCLIAGQPVELGKVQWMRDYDQALSKAQETRLPLLILFQEVPGCATCTAYGRDVLSHPLIVDLIQSSFVPVAIYNNKKGKDAAVLNKYGEPAWNNPVVRIVDHEEQDVVERVAGNYTPLGLVQAMKKVLHNWGTPIPDYVDLMEESLLADHLGTDVVTYSMYCFWTGEKLFGNEPGVIKTRAGWANGKEVVQVTFLPSQVSRKELDRLAAANSCEYEHIKSNVRDDRQPKYYLSNSMYKYLPLSEIQASRINSLLGTGEEPFDLLSPTQKKWYVMIQKRQKTHYPNRIQKDFVKAWDDMTSLMQRT